MAKRQSLKGKAKTKASHTPLLDAENAEILTAPSGSSYNAELLVASYEALGKLREELWPGVESEPALGIGQGGEQAAFDANLCKMSLFGDGDGRSKKYKCSQSIFWCDTLFNADPSVPLRQCSINDLGERFYSKPAPLHGCLKLAVPGDWIQQCCDKSKAKPVSPMENMMAFVLSIYRDIDDEQKLAEWKRYALSVDTEYIVANSDDEIFFANTNCRQDLKAAKESMTHTTLQKIFSVLHCKSRMEKSDGPLSSEAFCQKFAQSYRPASKEEEVTDGFVDTAITLSKRVLNHQGLLDLLLKADEEQQGSNPFDSWTKLQLIVQKCRTPKYTEWVFHALYDGWRNGHMPSDFMTWRGLRETLNGRGGIDVMIGMYEFREYLFAKVIGEFDWNLSVITKMKEYSALHNIYREKNGFSGDLDADLTWRGGWPKSAEMFCALLEDALFSDTFLQAFKNLVRHRKPVPDWVDNNEISGRLDGVRTQYEKEMKAAKKLQAPDPEVEELGETTLRPEETQEDDKGLGHLQVRPVQVAVTKNKKGGQDVQTRAPDLEEETLKKVEVFKKKALQIVRTHVKLIVEEDNTTVMTKALATTGFADWRGEVNEDTREITKSVVIFFDTKLAGEAGTQPTLRLPPLRDGRHGKLFAAAINLRYNADLGNIQEGDAVVFLDGGRDGLVASMYSAIKPSSGNMTKHKMIKFLLWSEKSLRERKHRDRGAQVSQIEKMHIVLPEDQVFSSHSRLAYPGTNRGDTIHAIQAPSWDDGEETWRLPLSSKKVLYSKINRVAVGGKLDGAEPSEKTDKQGRRRDADEEPVAYHSLPTEAVTEIFHELNIGYMLDLSCCDGKAAFAAICRRVPYVGVTFTEDHVSLLMRRLEAQVFLAMQTAGSPLYEPALEMLVSKKGKAKAKAQGKKKKTSDADKEAEDDEDEGPDGEDDEDGGCEEEDENHDGEGEDDQDENAAEDDEEGPEEEDEQMEDDENEGEGPEEDEEGSEEEAVPAPKGTKRKYQPKKAACKAKGKAKAKAKGKAKARGRPKAGTKKAKDVLSKLSSLMD